MQYGDKVSILGWAACLLPGTSQPSIIHLWTDLSRLQSANFQKTLGVIFPETDPSMGRLLGQILFYMVTTRSSTIKLPFVC